MHSAASDQSLNLTDTGGRAATLLVLAPFLSREYSGTAHGAISVIKALSERAGLRLHVASFVIEPGAVPDHVPRTILTQPPNRRLVWRVGRAFTVRDHVRSLRAAKLPDADVMYTQSLDMALAYAELFPTVRIVTHLGHVIGSREVLADTPLTEPWRAIDVRIIDRLEARCYRLRQSRHWVSTPLVGEQRAAHFGLPGDCFEVHPLGIETDRFSDRSQRRTVREKLGVPDDACVIISVSRLVKWKNIDWLVNALNGIPPHAHLLIVGKGPQREALQAAVPSAAASRVHFVGHVDPAPMLAAADIFALPSAIESFGIAYAEAMCMALPCIGLQNAPPEILSTAQDVIVPGVAGIVVADEPSFRDALTMLSTDRARREAMGQAAREHALLHYSSERYADALEQVVCDDTMALQAALHSGA